MKWLLDTNVLIHAQRGDPAAVRRRLTARSPADLVLSVVTIAELWYGALRSADPALKRSLWSRAVEPYEVLPFDRAAAEAHADLRHNLRHAPIGERDLLIAATALVHGLAVVSSNRSEFSRVPGLRSEDWTREPDPDEA
jgi:tRNA(fMet)-specific endonuclease VapC